MTAGRTDTASIAADMPDETRTRPNSTSKTDARAGGSSRTGGTGESGRRRDRSIDAARAYAIAGVVLGHWLVTGLVLGPDGLRTASPLSAMPALAPATWALQTLGLFFFAGGYAAGRRPVTTRKVGGRLVLPVLALLGALGVVLFIGAALGLPTTTLRTIGMLVLSPLWFLLPYLALRAATGALRPAVARIGIGATLPPLLVVAAADFGLLPAIAAVPTTWAVPWLLGMWLANRDRPSLPDHDRPSPPDHDRARMAGRVSDRAVGALLALGGGAALAFLVLRAGYPASAVGIPGDGRSNLSPPSLLAVALAVTQIGVFLLLRAPLARALARDVCWRPVAALNRVAVPVYLRHQSVLLAVAGIAALAAPSVPGLLAAPTGVGWVLARLGWLPVLALGLALVTRGRQPLRGNPAATRRTRLF